MAVFEDQPSCVLAIYAHPDDAEVSCGGALARWARAGAAVHVLVAARGDKGATDVVARPEELVAARLAESEAAGMVLGIASHLWLDHADGDVVNDAALRSELVEHVRAVQPDVVVAPDPTAVFFGGAYVNHPDHRAVGWAALDAVMHAAPNPNYDRSPTPAWTVNTLLLSGTLEPDTWVDIAATIDAKTAALACHTSQLGDAGEWLRTVVRQRAEDGGRTAGVALAEGFRRVGLSA